MGSNSESGALNVFANLLQTKTHLLHSEVQYPHYNRIGRAISMPFTICIAILSVVGPANALLLLELLQLWVGRLKILYSRVRTKWVTCIVPKRNKNGNGWTFFTVIRSGACLLNAFDRVCSSGYLIEHSLSINPYFVLNKIALLRWSISLYNTINS